MCFPTTNVTIVSLQTDHCRLRPLSLPGLSLATCHLFSRCHLLGQFWPTNNVITGHVNKINTVVSDSIGWYPPQGRLVADCHRCCQRPSPFRPNFGHRRPPLQPVTIPLPSSCNHLSILITSPLENVVVCREVTPISGPRVNRYAML